jgi:peptide/nickel transport system substrate-binding protein
MRWLIAPLFVLALAPIACRPQPEGTIKVVVIGAEPRLRDPASGPIAPPDAILLQNVAQGLVRFDAAGNIVGGLAERWNVSDDGLSYIFRIAASEWPGGGKITAQQVARLLKRAISGRSKNTLKDSLGAVEDVVAMTDRVIEIRVTAPRPNLLALLAQPELAILRNSSGTGPFHAADQRGPNGALRLERAVTDADAETSRSETLLISASPADEAVQGFVKGASDLVLGGTLSDLPYPQGVKLPRGSLRFDPASGLFGLAPMRTDGPFGSPEARRLLSAALDRTAFVTALGVPGLGARATLLEANLDGVAAPTAPGWMARPIEERRPLLQADAHRLFSAETKLTLRVALPQGPGSDRLLEALQRDWGALGLAVERAASVATADFALIDEVAPSSSPAWFVRRFRCGTVRVCDSDIDELVTTARTTLIPAQRYALLAQAAARIDEDQLFIPITAPIRWSLVGPRIEGFAGNRFARHTLTDLEEKPGRGN